jgi:hypothetical protein
MQEEPTIESIVDTIRHTKTLDGLRSTVLIFKKLIRPPAGSQAAIISALRERTRHILEEERVRMWAEIMALEQFFDKEETAEKRSRLQVVSS